MDPRTTLAIEASRRWYDDVFALHRAEARADGRLWVAASEPPPWHSAVKTLIPDVRDAEVLAAMEQHPTGSVADSFGTLDLAPHGFELLIDASWVLHPGAEDASWPEAWVVVDDASLLERWSSEHDYEGVLTPAVLENPAFTVLARMRGGAPVAGAVVHDGGRATDVSNLWSADGRLSPGQVAEVLACAAVVRPDIPVVDYAQGDELAVLIGCGYQRLGPQRVWLRR